MPADDLRQAVKALMGQAKSDLAELVSFQSVADPKQFPPEECAKAAALGRRRVRRGRLAGRHELAHAGRFELRPRTRSRPPTARRPCCCIATTTSSRRSARTRGRARCSSSPSATAAGTAAAPPTARATSSMHLTALRALATGQRRLPVRHQADLRGLRGTGDRRLEAFVPENVELLRADTILVVDTGNFAVGVPTLTTTLRGMTSVDVTVEALAQPDALGHVRRPRAGPGRRA